MDLLKFSRFPNQKRLHNIGNLNLAIEVLKGFKPGVFNRLCVTHSKSSNSGNLEPKIELIIFLSFKVALKALIVSSDT